MRQNDLSCSRRPSSTLTSSWLMEVRSVRSSVGVVGRSVVPGARVFSSSDVLLPLR